MLSVLDGMGGKRVEAPYPGLGASRVGDPRSPCDAEDAAVPIDPARTWCVPIVSASGVSVDFTEILPLLEWFSSLGRLLSATDPPACLALNSAR